MTNTRSCADVRVARLAAHGLTSGLRDPRAVIERMLCVQAQDFAAARWAIGVRSPGNVDADVIHAIESDRSMVRSWPMRGTLHLVEAGMLRPILALTAQRQLKGAAKRHRDLGIDDTVHGAAREVALRELGGGRSLTRDELQAAWRAAGIATDGQRGYHLIWRLALDGVLCCGPVDTRTRQRFVLLDEWAPPAPDAPTDDDQILGVLFSRYVRGHGPATLRDFAWWSGLTLAHAKTALACAGEQVAPFDDDRWLSADADAPAAPSGYLALGAFDEYYLGYADRGAACPPEYATQVTPGGNGVFLPVLVADGQVVGTWKRLAASRTVTDVSLRWFGARSPTPTGAFHATLAAWAAFQGTALRHVA